MYWDETEVMCGSVGILIGFFKSCWTLGLPPKEGFVQPGKKTLKGFNEVCKGPGLGLVPPCYHFNVFNWSRYRPPKVHRLVRLSISQMRFGLRLYMGHSFLALGRGSFNTIFARNSRQGVILGKGGGLQFNLLCISS